MANTPRHGKGTVIYFNKYDVTGVYRDSKVETKIDTAKASVYGLSDHVYTIGHRDTVLTGEGILEGAAAQTHDLIQQTLAGSTQVVVTWGPEGDTIGRIAKLIAGDVTKFDEMSPAKDVVKFASSIQASGRAGGSGSIGHWLAALSARTSTASMTNVDSGIAAGTSLGGVGHLHCTVNSTLTTGHQWKIQHSSAAASWADIISFTLSTSDLGTVQRSTYSGTVKRYVRATLFALGGGASKSNTAAVAFARHML